jgi:alpha-L-rhamnosidase
MFGEVSAWYYKALGGIFPDEQQPGFKNVALKPNFVKGLDHFEAKYISPYGLIISSWKKSGNKILYNVNIPPNSTAVLHLTANEVLESEKSLSENKFIRTEYDENKNFYIYLKSGEYKFSIKK